MHPILELGKIQIPTYGLMSVIGFGVSLFVMLHIAKWFHIPKEDIVYASIYSIGGIVIGAKFIFFLTKLPAVLSKIDVFFERPIETLEYMFGGWVFFGGLIGAMLGIYIYCRKYHLNPWSFADTLAPVIPLFHTFGRVGCHLAGCCYGIEYQGIFSITYPYSIYTEGFADVPRVPVQLIEAGFNCILFLVLYFYVKRKSKPGRSLGIYLIAYSIARFTLEFLRGDYYRGRLLWLSTSQWISLLIIPLGIWIICGNHIEKKCNVKYNE